MCGRYVLSIVGDELATSCEVAQSHPFDSKCYNIAPSQEVPVVLRGPVETNVFTSMSWGFKTGRKINGVSKPLINARVETVTEKPTFRDSIKQRRCLVPASGFYEWKDRQPHFIFREEKKIMFLAGIWKAALSDPQKKEFAIITTAANPGISDLHHRMPLLIPDKMKKDWLTPEAKIEKLLSDLRGLQAKIKLDFYPVSPKVNSVQCNNEELIQPYSEPQERLF